jgi:hypothetical protein
MWEAQIPRGDYLFGFCLRAGLLAGALVEALTSTGRLVLSQ